MEIETYEQRLHRHYATRRARLIRPRNGIKETIAARPADDLPRPSFDIIKKRKVAKQIMLTDTQIDEMQKMKAAGASFRHIAKAIGCSHTTSRKYARAEQ